MYHFQLHPTRKENLQWHSLLTEGNYISPPCEIVEQEKQYSIALDIPGFSKEQVSIEVEDRKLFVTGERKETERAEKDTVHRQERKFGKFSRVFTLPDHIQEEAIQANFENGVLNITLPKMEKSPGRKIGIQ